MDFNFTPEQEMLQKSVAEFLKKECPFETVKEIEESQEGYSKKLWKKMAGLEWLGICFPEELGGFGDPFFSNLIVLEEMGKRAFPSPFFSSIIECGEAILAGGTEEQKNKLLERIAAGKLIMALAVFEEDADYDADCIETSAVAAGENYVLEGTKLFVNDANIANQLLVLTKTESGQTLFLVDTKAAGVEITKMPSIAHENVCQVVLTNVSVPAGNILGEIGKGAEILKQTEQKRIIAKCAEMLGGCAMAIELTVDYARKRVQYGSPIGANQAIQHYIADGKLKYDSAISYFYKAAWMVDQGINAELEISALKALLNDGYNFITDRGVQIFGGVGTTREFDISLFFQRSKANELTLGGTAYHCEKVAIALGL